MTRARRWTAGLVIAATCALSSGCYETTSPQASGNTNWLSACDHHDSCGPEASCHCGTCTRLCARDAECELPGERARCVALAELDAPEACGAALATGSPGVCLAPCSTDADCGDDLSCVGDACVATPPAAARPPSTDAGPAAGALQEQARSEAALRAVIEQSRNASLPSDASARIWSCEAGALRIDPAGYDEAFAIDVVQDAVLIAGVATWGSDGVWRIERRRLSDLAPDPAFGTAGVVVGGGSLRADAARALATSSTHFYVAGVDDYLGGGQVRLERRSLASGELDATFGGASTVVATFDRTPAELSQRMDVARALAIDASHAYLGGTGFSIEKRRLEDGALATEFAAGGLAHGEASSSSLVSAVVLSKGLIHAAGTTPLGDMRLEARDAQGGELLYAVTQRMPDEGCATQGVALAADPGGSLHLAVGSAGDWRVQRRAAADGALEYERVMPSTGACDQASALVVDGAHLFVAGAFDGSWRIEKRRLEDGELVPSFGDDGSVSAELGGAATALAVHEGVLFIAGVEGARMGPQSSVWRVERRLAESGALLPCPGTAPTLPRAPECRGVATQDIAAHPGDAGCQVQVVTSSGCAATNVRASTDASAAQDWVLPEGAVLDDGVDASARLGPAPSSALLLRGFGLSVPDDARVLGVEVEIDRHSDEAGTVFDESVSLVHGATPEGESRARPGAWKERAETVTYGHPRDLWQAEWTPQRLNDPSFGVALRARADPTGSARYGAVRVHVYYCE